MPGRLKKFLLSVWEVVEVVFVATATVFLIRSFLVQPFLVSGASMEPNFSDGNYLIIDEITYRFRSPERGEVVVFRFPKDPSVFFIKRIIGMPGDTVTIDAGRVTIFNAVYPNGRLLEEPYINSNTSRTNNVSVILGSDEYFVMGDNRDASLDSRSFGPVKRSLIVGRTLFRGWPFDRIKRFTPPAYNL